MCMYIFIICIYICGMWSLEFGDEYPCTRRLSVAGPESPLKDPTSLSLHPSADTAGESEGE